MGELWNAITSDFGTGLLGALVGGGFTILGSAWQTRSTNKAAALAQAKANAQRGLDAITQLKVRLENQTFQGMGTPVSLAAWNRERGMLVTTANSAVMLLPDAHKDTRMYVLMLLAKIEAWRGLRPWPEYKLETGLLLSEAIKFLALYVRGSDVPERQNMNAVISRKVEQHRLQEARSELNDLLAEEEDRGPNATDVQRIHELLEFLGELHPSEPTADNNAETA
ncbi:hypothetical protein [Streptomyces sp. NPDC056661]|uniref:hypothetical protein n=1 Tax=Streptomyces sp. NPDC056661 TaxID=3345898 RepID=UPI00368377D1